jgi:Protein of unknown function (DUF4054)
VSGAAPSVTPFPLALQDFLARFPEFSRTDTTLLASTLNDAALVIDPSVWGSFAGQGHGYLTAHRLALSPFGQQARMVAKNGTTTYQAHYDRLVGVVGSGFRLL